MNPKLKKIVDSLNESESVELLEYVSDHVRKFNREKGEPSIDFSRSPEDNIRIFLDALQGLGKKSDESP